MNPASGKGNQSHQFMEICQKVPAFLRNSEKVIYGDIGSWQPGALCAGAILDVFSHKRRERKREYCMGSRKTQFEYFKKKIIINKKTYMIWLLPMSNASPARSSFLTYNVDKSLCDRSFEMQRIHLTINLGT